MVVILHAKLQVNVWMFVSGWKWYTEVKMVPSLLLLPRESSMFPDKRKTEDSWVIHLNFFTFWDRINSSLKVLKVLKYNLYGFSHTVRETRTLVVFRTNKIIDGLNLKKPFWVHETRPLWVFHTSKPSMA